MRKDLGVYQRHIEDLELLDYRVRVFQGGTDAVTRVLIEFGDSTGARWSTVGVSGNIIDASFQALVDAIDLQARQGRRGGAVAPRIFFAAGNKPPRSASLLHMRRHAATREKLMANTD